MVKYVVENAHADEFFQQLCLPVHSKIQTFLLDMKEERSALSRVAFPVLQEYCRSQGLDFHVVDLRLGAGMYVDSELTSSSQHLKEINTCNRLSIAPCFIVS